jgi:hypothetical protein
MPDLYAILTKAIHGLDPNTKEARRRLYERARAALVAETRGLQQPEADFLEVLGSLEEAIQKLEAEAEAQAERERRIRNLVASTSDTLPPGNTVKAPPRPARVPPRPVKAPPRPATPIARPRFGQFMPLVARALRLGRDGARNLLWPEHAEELASAHELDREPARDNDTWLSDLLARASRTEHENGDATPPRRDTRRNR